MSSRLSEKWLAIGARCSAYASCASAAVVIFSGFCPPYAFGLSDNEVARGLGAAGLFAIFLSLVNAVFAIGMMVRFPKARDSFWLGVALILWVLIVIFTPAEQTA